MKLAFSALTKTLFGFLLFLLLLFVPAGTWHYFGGWLFIGLLFVPMIVLGIVLFVKNPDMLRKRLDAKEKENTQKAVIAVSALGFTLAFVLAGLDHRFGWSAVPTFAVWIAAAVFLVGYAAYAEVIRENAYLSRTVQVVAGQTVVDTGLYSIVRHPMYLATILMFLAAPIVLGSWYAFLVFLFYPIVIAVRIHGEEKLLAKELNGYTAYQQKVKYRLLPFVW